MAKASPDPADARPSAAGGVLLRSHGRMTQISDLLSANQAYSAARANVADPRPGRRLAVVTCMDARIDVFAVLGLHLGEAHVIRNAGDASPTTCCAAWPSRAASWGWTLRW